MQLHTNTAEASSPGISDDGTVPSETSPEETDNDTSYVTDAKLVKTYYYDSVN